MNTMNALVKFTGYAVLLVGVSPLLPIIGVMWLLALLGPAESTSPAGSTRPVATDNKKKSKRKCSEPGSIFGLSNFESVHPA